MLFVLLMVGLFFYSFINFKKAFLLYLIFDLFWFSGTKVLTTDSPLSVGVMSSIFFVLRYGLLIVSHNKPVGDQDKFPYFWPFVLVCISHFLSCFTSLAGFFPEFIKCISFILQHVIVIWMIWKLVIYREDFLFIAKGILIVFIFAILYMAYEMGIQDNPLLTYKFSLTSIDMNVYTLDMLRGYKASSIFEHPIGAGMNFGLVAVWYIIMLFKFDEKINYKAVYTVVALLSLVCVLMTKMRSGLLFSILSFMSVIDYKIKSVLKIAMLLLFFGICAYPFVGSEAELLFSGFNVDGPSTVGGSNIEQRLMQFEAARIIMNDSFYFGFGSDVLSNFMGSKAKLLLALESVWLEEMTMRGVVGVLVTLFFAIYSIVIIPIKYHCKEVFFLSVAYWIVYSCTSIPFFREYLYYIVVFYCIRKKIYLYNSKT